MTNTQQPAASASERPVQVDRERRLLLESMDKYCLYLRWTALLVVLLCLVSLDTPLDTVSNLLIGVAAGLSIPYAFCIGWKSDGWHACFHTVLVSSATMLLLAVPMGWWALTAPLFTGLSAVVGTMCRDLWELSKLSWQDTQASMSRLASSPLAALTAAEFNTDCGTDQEENEPRQVFPEVTVYYGPNVHHGYSEGSRKFCNTSIVDAVVQTVHKVWRDRPWLYDNHTIQIVVDYCPVPAGLIHGDCRYSSKGYTVRTWRPADGEDKAELSEIPMSEVPDLLIKAAESISDMGNQDINVPIPQEKDRDSLCETAQETAVYISRMRHIKIVEGGDTCFMSPVGYYAQYGREAFDKVPGIGEYVKHFGHPMAREIPEIKDSGGEMPASVAADTVSNPPYDHGQAIPWRGYWCRHCARIINPFRLCEHLIDGKTTYKPGEWGELRDYEERLAKHREVLISHNLKEGEIKAACGYHNINIMEAVNEHLRRLKQAYPALYSEISNIRLIVRTDPNVVHEVAYWTDTKRTRVRLLTENIHDPCFLAWANKRTDAM